MSARIFAAVFAALAIAFAASAPAEVEENTHDLIKCNSQPGDVELTHVQIVDVGHYAGQVGIDFIYPPEDAPANNAINCIIIKTLDPDGSGAATITGGGLGETRVTIHLSSSFTKGAAFTVQILGQPTTVVPTTAP